MSAAAADLLTLLGALIVVIGGTSAYWVWRDAREAAALRKREAAMADELQRSVRQARHRHDDRHMHEREGAPE